MALAMAAIVTAMNRVNGIYERDVAVRMVLVAKNDKIVYTNAGTDPYSNSDGFAMLAQNQSNLDAEIGSENYDVSATSSAREAVASQLWASLARMGSKRKASQVFPIQPETHSTSILCPTR